MQKETEIGIGAEGLAANPKGQDLVGFHDTQGFEKESMPSEVKSCSEENVRDKEGRRAREDGKKKAKKMEGFEGIECHCADLLVPKNEEFNDSLPLSPGMPMIVLEYSCIHSSPSYIICGTNHGEVAIYERRGYDRGGNRDGKQNGDDSKEKNLEDDIDIDDEGITRGCNLIKRLAPDARTENVNLKITCLSLDPKENVLAIGNSIKCIVWNGAGTKVLTGCEGGIVVDTTVPQNHSMGENLTRSIFASKPSFSISSLSSTINSTSGGLGLMNSLFASFQSNLLFKRESSVEQMEICKIRDVDLLVVGFANELRLYYYPLIAGINTLSVPVQGSSYTSSFDNSWHGACIMKGDDGSSGDGALFSSWVYASRPKGVLLKVDPRNAKVIDVLYPVLSPCKFQMARGNIIPELVVDRHRSLTHVSDENYEYGEKGDQFSDTSLFGRLWSISIGKTVCGEVMDHPRSDFILAWCKTGALYLIDPLNTNYVVMFKGRIHDVSVIIQNTSCAVYLLHGQPKIISVLLIRRSRIYNRTINVAAALIQKAWLEYASCRFANGGPQAREDQKLLYNKKREALEKTRNGLKEQGKCRIASPKPITYKSGDEPKSASPKQTRAWRQSYGVEKKVDHQQKERILLTHLQKQDLLSDIRQRRRQRKAKYMEPCASITKSSIPKNCLIEDCLTERDNFQIDQKSFYEYDVTLVAPNGLGLNLNLIGNKVIVADLKPLGNGEPSPAQICGVISLGDVLISINGNRFDSLTLDGICSLLHTLHVKDEGPNVSHEISLKFMFSEAVQEEIDDNPFLEIIDEMTSPGTAANHQLPRKVTVDKINYNNSSSYPSLPPNGRAKEKKLDGKQNALGLSSMDNLTTGSDSTPNKSLLSVNNSAMIADGVPLAYQSAATQVTISASAGFSATKEFHIHHSRIRKLLNIDDELHAATCDYEDMEYSYSLGIKCRWGEFGSEDVTVAFGRTKDDQAEVIRCISKDVRRMYTLYNKANTSGFYEDLRFSKLLRSANKMQVTPVMAASSENRNNTLNIDLSSCRQLIASVLQARDNKTLEATFDSVLRYNQYEGTDSEESIESSTDNDTSCVAESVSRLNKSLQTGVVFLDTVKMDRVTYEMASWIKPEQLGSPRNLVADYYLNSVDEIENVLQLLSKIVHAAVEHIMKHGKFESPKKSNAKMIRVVSSSSNKKTLSLWPPPYLTYKICEAISIQQQNLIISTAETNKLLQEWQKCFQPAPCAERGKIHDQDNSYRSSKSLDESFELQSRYLVFDLVTRIFQVNTIWHMMKPEPKRGNHVFSSLCLDWVVNDGWSPSISKIHYTSFSSLPIQWNEKEAIIFLDTYGAYIDLDKIAAACCARKFLVGLEKLTIEILPMDTYFRIASDSLMKIVSTKVSTNDEFEIPSLMTSIFGKEVGSLSLVRSSPQPSFCLLLAYLPHLLNASIDTTVGICVSYFPDLRPEFFKNAIFFLQTDRNVMNIHRYWKWGETMKYYENNKDQELDSELKITYCRYLNSIIFSDKNPVRGTQQNVARCFQDVQLVIEFVRYAMKLEQELIEFPCDLSFLNMSHWIDSITSDPYFFFSIWKDLLSIFDEFKCRAGILKLSYCANLYGSGLLQSAYLLCKELQYHCDIEITILEQLPKLAGSLHNAVCDLVSPLPKNSSKIHSTTYGNSSKASSPEIMGCKLVAMLAKYFLEIYRLQILYKKLKHKEGKETYIEVNWVFDSFFDAVIIAFNNLEEQEKESTRGDEDWVGDLDSIILQNFPSVDDVSNALIEALGPATALELLQKVQEIRAEYDNNPLSSLTPNFFRNVTIKYAECSISHDYVKSVLSHTKTFRWSKPGHTYQKRSILPPALEAFARKELHSLQVRQKNDKVVSRSATPELVAEMHDSNTGSLEFRTKGMDVNLGNAPHFDDSITMKEYQGGGHGVLLSANIKNTKMKGSPSSKRSKTLITSKKTKMKKKLSPKSSLLRSSDGSGSSHSVDGGGLEAWDSIFSEKQATDIPDRHRSETDEYLNKFSPPRSHLRSESARNGLLLDSKTNSEEQKEGVLTKQNLLDKFKEDSNLNSEVAEEGGNSRSPGAPSNRMDKSQSNDWTSSFLSWNPVESVRPPHFGMEIDPGGACSMCQRPLSNYVLGSNYFLVLPCGHAFHQLCYQDEDACVTCLETNFLGISCVPFPM